MNTKNIFKALALAMLMPAMLLTTACSSEDDLVNNTANTENTINKGYALPVTVNVTREGDAGTRATYTDNGNGTGSLAFSAGDKLFVSGTHTTAGQFAGELTWQSGGTFSGTISTANTYSGTAEELLSAASPVSAILLPAGYNNYDFLTLNTNNGYDATISTDLSKTFALTKAAAVEQFSLERTFSYSNGFTLYPSYGILNFTITGLTPNTDVDVTFSDYTPAIYGNTMGGTVHTDGSGNATFAVAVYAYSSKNIQTCTLYVNGKPITLVSTSKPIDAGKIYNITRNALPDLLSGVFSVSDSKKVKFSKGNLRYASGTWSFFDNQYDYYTSYSADAWDKFGWSTSATTYGMNTSTDKSTYSGNFVDWGSNSDLQTALGTGWFTLSKDESKYLFNTRSASNGRYARAKVNNVQGVILFPDTYTHPDGVTAPTNVNTDNASFASNTYTIADWTKMESAGCVFLPGAGYRDGESVISAGNFGAYWSATSSGKASDYSAYDFVYYHPTWLSPEFTNTRNLGFCVRLVREVTE